MAIQYYQCSAARLPPPWSDINVNGMRNAKMPHTRSQMHKSTGNEETEQEFTSVYILKKQSCINKSWKKASPFLCQFISSPLPIILENIMCMFVNAFAQISLPRFVFSFISWTDHQTQFVIGNTPLHELVLYFWFNSQVLYVKGNVCDPMHLLLILKISTAVTLRTTLKILITFRHVGLQMHGPNFTHGTGYTSQS